MTIQKLPGRNTSIEEQRGKGTVINARDGKATGACCVCDDCSITTEANCIAMGGQYHGDGTACGGGIICLPLLFADSISASVMKCGFQPFHIVDCEFPNTDHGYSTTLNFTGCCSNFGDCATSGGGSVDPNKFYLTRSFSFSGHTQEEDECNGCATPCESGSGSYSYDPITCIGSGDTFECHPFGGGNCCVTGSWTLSEEYTTEMLIAAAVAALPEYPGTFSGGFSASRDLADDESSYTIQRFKYKFVFLSPPAADCKLCWNEHFVPDEGDPVDTPRSFTFDGLTSETTVLEVLEPDEDGEITITDVRFNDC